MKLTKYEVIIIGGGPGGLTAGLYACRAGLKTLLLERGIFGGHDLTGAFAGLAGCALYCVTEVHSREDIDKLADALREIVGR